MSIDLNPLHNKKHVWRLMAVVVAAPLMAGCSGLSGISDFSLKDQEWFARPAKLFKGGGNSSIETPPLSPTSPITPNDLVSADGQCPGGPPPAAPVPAAADANASAEGQAAPPPAAPVALGHTECDVVRAIAVAPDNVSFSNNERGERVALVTWQHGPRPGAYTFTAGRLTAIERVDVPEPPKPARPAPKARKKRAATSSHS